MEKQMNMLLTTQEKNTKSIYRQSVAFYLSWQIQNLTYCTTKTCTKIKDVENKYRFTFKFLIVVLITALGRESVEWDWKVTSGHWVPYPDFLFPRAVRTAIKKQMYATPHKKETSLHDVWISSHNERFHHMYKNNMWHIWQSSGHNSQLKLHSCSLKLCTGLCEKQPTFSCFMVQRGNCCFSMRLQWLSAILLWGKCCSLRYPVPSICTLWEQ